jgi:Flp pilus assembly protein TadB
VGWRSVLFALFPWTWLLQESLRRTVGVWLEGARERKNIFKDLRLVVDQLQASLAVGMPLRGAFERMGRENWRSGVFRENIDKVTSSLALGRSLKETLDSTGAALLSGKGESRTVGVLFSSLALCEELGANTEALLGSLKVRLGEREELIRRMAAGTAQVRFQAFVLCVSPLAFAVGYLLLSPSKLKFFTDTWVGISVLGVSLGLNGAGAYTTWKMVARWKS